MNMLSIDSSAAGFVFSVVNMKNAIQELLYMCSSKRKPYMCIVNIHNEGYYMSLWADKYRVLLWIVLELVLQRKDAACLKSYPSLQPDWT
jgi:hypothetical protein